MPLTKVIPKAQKNPIFDIQLNIEGYDDDLDLGTSGIRGVVIYVKSILKDVRRNQGFSDPTPPPCPDLSETMNPLLPPPPRTSGPLMNMMSKFGYYDDHHLDQHTDTQAAVTDIKS